MDSTSARLRTAGRVLFGREVPAEGRRHAEDREEVGTHTLLPDVARLRPAARRGRHEIDASRPVGKDRCFHAARVIADLVAELGLPGRLSEVGVGADQYATIAAHALHDSWLHANPRKIDSAEQVLQILEAAA